MQVPTEELKKVDFSKIKLKTAAAGSAAPEGSTADVFLARPKEDTTSGTVCHKNEAFRRHER
jgi:hypothetical protein